MSKGIVGAVNIEVVDAACLLETLLVWNMIDFIGHFGGTGVSQ